NVCCKALMIAGGLMMLGFYIAAYLYFPSEEWLALIGIVPAIAAFLAIKFLDREQRERSIQSLTVASVIMAFLISAIASSRIGRFQDSPQFMADIRRLGATADVRVATYDYFEPSIVYYAGQTVHRLNTPREVADFMSSHRNAFVITRPSRENELRDEI